MGKSQQRRAAWAMQGKLSSPGRPPVARRDDRVVFWAAIAAGVRTSEAARLVDVSEIVGSRWFRETGGMNPQLGPVSGRYLSFREREEIAMLSAQGVGVREVARRVGRSPSTISRELRRNAATRTDSAGYRASTAQWHADRRARRPKVAKLAECDRLREYVQARLSGEVCRLDGSVAGPQTPAWKGRNRPRRKDRRWATAWSPEQISARLKVDFPDDESMRISHEAIYQALFIQSRGALKREQSSPGAWCKR